MSNARRIWSIVRLLGSEERRVTEMEKHKEIAKAKEIREGSA